MRMLMTTKSFVSDGVMGFAFRDTTGYRIDKRLPELKELTLDLDIHNINSLSVPSS
jgi:hypothetical protein